MDSFPSFTVDVEQCLCSRLCLSSCGPPPPAALGLDLSIRVRLVKELNRTCRAMQQRVVELISRVSNEEVTEELLHVNDDLNNIFLRYERYGTRRDLHFSQ